MCFALSISHEMRLKIYVGSSIASEGRLKCRSEGHLAEEVGGHNKKLVDTNSADFLASLLGPEGCQGQEVGGRGVGGPFLVNVAQKALIPPGLIKLSTGKGHRPQTRQNDLKLQHQTEVAWEVGGLFFVNCAQKALISPRLINLSTGKGHRPQTRQNNLKLRHQTEVAWEVGGPSIQ
ncbi:hypothetical protein B0H16DRAFT_1478050 [Mycena metata]|uniref:Uncharacterized protein n=1 Tax=Mycena metata TaxID=1033252 RepID=A0AAD7MEV5_9AGAR|nr:hypothetical protein B0H16DRAFT_1478047 [Mycena metata]KAJ7714374.1 hypothetical protein B0H16DRAFT_1478050 [Mycena metata]